MVFRSLKPLERREPLPSLHRNRTSAQTLKDHSATVCRNRATAQAAGSGCFINHFRKHNLPFDFVGDATPNSVGVVGDCVSAVLPGIATEEQFRNGSQQNHHVETQRPVAHPLKVQRAAFGGGQEVASGYLP
jgi:hypothetical protein